VVVKQSMADGMACTLHRAKSLQWLCIEPLLSACHDTIRSPDTQAAAKRQLQGLPGTRDTSAKQGQAEAFPADERTDSDAKGDQTGNAEWQLSPKLLEALCLTADTVRSPVCRTIPTFRSIAAVSCRDSFAQQYGKRTHALMRHTSHRLCLAAVMLHRICSRLEPYHWAMPPLLSICLSISLMA
jgi:hypothetical protein